MIIDLFNSTIPETLTVRVTPKAASNRIKVEHNKDGSKLIKIYVTTVPEDGKANKAVIEILAKELGVAKSSIEIIRGHTSKDKLIRIIK